MDIIKRLKDKILKGDLIEKEEALLLVDADLDELSEAANEIRVHFCGNDFDICTIINGKSGRCSEDCKYCAQSSFYNTSIDSYELLPKEKLLEQALYNDEKGVLRYSIVTSGRALNETEIEKVCESVREIGKHSNIKVCASPGLLNEAEFSILKDSGVTRIHNNLETSKNNFPNVCTTHTFEDKIFAIKAAQNAGLDVCSGGIMGLGESFEDRIDMALSIRELNVNSVPINMLNPIPNTPYENIPLLSKEEMRRVVAIYRFLLPKASIRLAGGRGLLEDKGRSCFSGGANGAISGDMLTTDGITIDTDMKMIDELGYIVSLHE